MRPTSTPPCGAGLNAIRASTSTSPRPRRPGSTWSSACSPISPVVVCVGDAFAVSPNSNQRSDATSTTATPLPNRSFGPKGPTPSFENTNGLSGTQGNRISDLGEELCEVGVLPAGPFDFDTQGAFGGFLGQEIKGHMAQDGEVMRAVIAAVSGIVLIHNHVQDPMQVVFDCPMGPCRVPESFRRQWRAQQVIGRLGGDLGCRFTGAGDLADGGEARPLMEFLQPSDVG